MKVKIFSRNSIKVDQADNAGGNVCYLPFRDESDGEYETRINNFIESVEVVQILVETTGNIDDGVGSLASNLVVVYKDKN